MHEHFGAHAGLDPDPAPRAYRIDVLVDGVSEAECVALMHRIADLLVETGIARDEESEDVHAIIALHRHTWTEGDIGAPHVVIPKAVPRSPDLGHGYSPN